MSSAPRLLSLLTLLLLALAPRAQQPQDDTFLAGYVAAVLEREFHIAQATVRVQQGVVTVTTPLGAVDRDRVLEVLGVLPGVTAVRLTDAEPTPPQPPLRPLPAIERTADATVAEIDGGGSTFLLQRPLLFAPLLADPRWPHFAAAYHSYHGNDELDNVASVSFGESFSLWRGGARDGVQCELGVQAGVFAIFDLDAPSKDLVNADYFVGPVFCCRSGDWSLLARVYHQSSHLGDEYLLRTRTNRVNLSYEVGDLLLSCDLGHGLRLYGGGGHLFDSEPHLDPWLVQGGVEYSGPRYGSLRPIAAVDVQSRQLADWERDVSVRAGVQFENVETPSMRMQVLLEYYRGRSPNGQFLDQDIEFYGVGLHFFF